MGRQPVTGEPLTEIYPPDVQRCTQVLCPHSSAENISLSRQPSPLISQGHYHSHQEVFRGTRGSLFPKEDRIELCSPEPRGRRRGKGAKMEPKGKGAGWSHLEDLYWFAQKRPKRQRRERERERDIDVSGEVRNVLRHSTMQNMSSCTNRRQRAGDQDGSSHPLMSAALEDSAHRISQCAQRLLKHKQRAERWQRNATRRRSR
ncbi:uncharacterized protein LOC129604905 isoform X2 [Betta splendens]|uniref:Uncharacterized protein LOC129604905 isoform X2 n=1 Tax=Betta splendens TaxID=158456 RepID=A0A9W2Y5B9_BETSP|nr:uncharacterized protein LOC129604905 isoform X2 [Betta splendens]